jgi:hypothetical protein
MLVMGQRRAFARGAHRHDPVRAFGDLPLHQRFQRVEIHGTVGKGRDERGHRTFEHRFGLSWLGENWRGPYPRARNCQVRELRCGKRAISCEFAAETGGSGCAACCLPFVSPCRPCRRWADADALNLALAALAEGDVELAAEAASELDDPSRATS